MNARPMTDAQISRALRAHLPEAAAPGLRERVSEAAETTAQLRSFPSFLGALNDADPVSRRGSLLIAAALLVALAFASAAAVGALRLLQRDPILELSLEPPAEVMPTVRPSFGPSPSPRPTPTPILWTEARLEEDWPAPVRSEPAGGAIARPILLNIVPVDAESCCKLVELGREFDLTNDTGSDVISWIDIEVLSLCARSCLELWLPGPPPNVDPTEQWIAYGVVVDDDGDGVADRRIGVDNVPVTPGSAREHRTWITDLHTGRTVSVTGDSYGLGDFTFEGTSYPGVNTEQPNGGPSCPGDSAQFNFAGGDIAGGGTFSRLPGTFYAWASVIAGGRVVATDYAPDNGWLQPSSKAPPSAPDPEDPCPAG